MTEQSLGIFIENLNTYNHTELSSLLKSIKEIHYAKDYVIFTEFFVANQIYNWGLLDTFYMKFFQGKILFLCEKEYLKHKDNILAESMLIEGLYK